MAIVYLGLGSNLGNKHKNLNVAIEEINKRIGSVVSQSDFVVTEPWGFESENSFLNAVICIITNIPPISLLQITQQIERDLGRTNKTSSNYEDRIIDIDILLYDDLRISSPQLTIPHPLMMQRDFVMRPLMQIMEQDHIRFLPKDDNEGCDVQLDINHKTDHVYE